MILRTDKKQTRNVLLDLLKIILTFLVVNIHLRVFIPNNAHLFGSYWSYTVPVFMTLSFFFMSKYFSKLRLPFRTIIFRIKRLFIPLLFWSIISFILNPKLLNIKNALLQLFTGKVVNTPLYYLNLLIFFTIVFWLITYLPIKFRVPINILIIITALIFDYSGIYFRFFNPLANEVRRSWGQIDELIKYASLGILFGYLVKQKNNKIIFFGLAILTSMLLFFFKFRATPGFNYSGLELFFGTICVMSTLFFIGDIRLPPKISIFISAFSGYSFGVYLMHIIFLENFSRTLPTVRYLNNQFPLFFLIGYTIICYIFCFVFDQITLKKFSFLVK